MSQGDQLVALVTGASGGIGAAIAQRLARGGVHVIVAGRSEEALERVCRMLRHSDEGSAEPLVVDVSNKDSIRAALEKLAAGRAVNWLVNNAGIAVSSPLSTSLDDERDLYERHMAVNFHGARRLFEGLLPSMVERRYGRVVNVASSAGLRGYKYMAAYCASKHALVGYTRAVAHHLTGEGVTINAVCPHYVDSPMIDEAIRRLVEKTGKEEREVREFFGRQNPGGRLLTVGEVAEAVWTLLMTDRSGMLLELDGSNDPRWHMEHGV